MRRIWSLLLPAGALLLLASFYLPWQEPSLGDSGGVVAVLSGSFAASNGIDGWSSGVGPAAGLVTFLLAAAAAFAVARPRLSARLPLGRCALLAGYFAIAVGIEARSSARLRAVAAPGVHFHYACGAYVGAAGTIVMLLGAGALRRAELAPQLSARRLAALAAVVGLLVALLLPWARYVFAPSATALGIAAPAAAVVAVSSVWLLGLWWQADAGRRGQRLAVAAVAELFTGAALSSLTVLTTPVWGMWVGLAAACAIVVLASTDGIPIPRPELPQWVAIATCASAALLVVSLFLPWQNTCDVGAGAFASKGCVSTNGWTTELGVAIAVLALGVVVLTLVWSRPGAPVAALVAGVGLLVATLGFQLQDLSGAGFRLTFGYGSTVGFVAGGLLLVLAVPRSYPASVDRSRMLFRLAPMLACVAYLAFVLVPRWGVLTVGLQRQLRFAPISWLTISGALLAVWLLREWAGRVAADSENSERLVILPLALLSLAALDLIRLRAVGITWGGGAVVVLCLLLAMLGRVEQRGGLETFRMPEILRVDRL